VTGVRRAARAARFGAPLAPLVLLFGLNVTDELDGLAFAVFTPEVRDAFGSDDQTLIVIGSVAAVVSLLAALPAGVLADRVNRVRFAVVAAVVWGLMTVLTGVAPALGVLIVARIVSSVGEITNEPVHSSLLGDYYPPDRHPLVYTVHRLANPLSGLAGVLIGALGGAFGWRTTFVLLALPTFVLAVLALRLREPVRGATLDPSIAAAPQRPTVRFRTATRTLFAVPTLRRFWLAAFLFGIGEVPLLQFLSLFFEKVYALGAWGRGVETFLFSAGIVLGLGAGAVLAQRGVHGARAGWFALVVGITLGVGSAAFLLMALSPTLVLSSVFLVLAGAGVGAYQPAYYSLVNVIAPPEVRAQAYAWLVLFVGMGGVVSAVTLSGSGEALGYRVAIALLAGVLLLGSFVFVTAAHTADADEERQRTALAAGAG
jgi:MFS family permease